MRYIEKKSEGHSKVMKNAGFWLYVHGDVLRLSTSSIKSERQLLLENMPFTVSKNTIWERKGIRVKAILNYRRDRERNERELKT